MMRRCLAMSFVAGVATSLAPACRDFNDPTCARPIAGCAVPEVHVLDTEFSPNALTRSIRESARVTWIWGLPAVQVGHNVTFEDGQLNSGTQMTGMHVRTFTSPGDYRYRCTVHSTDFGSGMVGSVTVLP